MGTSPLYTSLALVRLLAAIALTSGCREDETVAPTGEGSRDSKPSLANVPFDLTGLEHLTGQATLELARDDGSFPTYPVFGRFSCESGQMAGITGTVVSDDDPGQLGTIRGRVIMPPFEQTADMGPFSIQGTVTLPNGLDRLGFYITAWTPGARSCTISDTEMRLDYDARGGAAITGPLGNGDIGSGTAPFYVKGYITIAPDATNFVVATSSAITLRFLGLKDPAAIAISPLEATHLVGTTHTMTVTVKDFRDFDGNGFGEPVLGTTVVFVVTGATTSEGWQCATNALGQCTLIYGGLVPGRDDILAFADINGDGLKSFGEPSIAATVMWRNKTPAVITVTDPEAVFDGTTKAVIAATNPAGLNGLSTAYSQGGSPVASPTNAGVYQVLATLDNEEYEADPVAGTLTIHPAQPSIQWNPPTAILLGTPLGSDQLNASATGVGGVGLGGAFTYSPASGTVLPAGPSHTLSVEFQPENSNYKKATKSVTLAVLYPFTGFFQPVENSTVVNSAKAGSAIPVKFALGGDRGLAVLDGAPTAPSYACGTTAEDAIEETVAASTSGLTYDAASGQYKYTWKTNNLWAGTCRKLVLTFVDGTKHEALFHFK